MVWHYKKKTLERTRILGRALVFQVKGKRHMRCCRRWFGWLLEENRVLARNQKRKVCGKKEQIGDFIMDL
jgi:hypothetical protein